MKRSHIKRYTRLAPKRRTKAEHERVYGDQTRQDWYRAHGCVACCRTPVQLHHTENGGISRKASADTLVPMCAGCHQELHQMGVSSFEAEHSVMLGGQTLRQWAERYAAAWLQYQGDACA